MAFYDALTALPNRALFNDRLHQMITDASWHGHRAGVMVLDLDRFKAVNDTLGHPTGDVLLREAAARLTRSVRTYDTVARLGGDEFAILLPEIRSGDDLGRVASKIVHAFKEPFLLEGKEVFVTTSIGIAVYPADSEDGDDLLKQADSAMYFAKRSGRNTFRFYSKDMTDLSNEKLLLESDLRRGFARAELELYYQPKVSLIDGMLIGSEALLRWNHPQRGMVPPDKFISIAEDSGLIVEIGEWVLRDACSVAHEWNGHGKPMHKVAINLSARQFQSNDLVRTVRKALKDTHCQPEWIELEITESLLMDEDSEVLETLNKFREMGITVAIDDFGTGYSSLSYLARFPIDTLKIDRSFTSKVTEGGHHSELVKAIISIAKSLNQKVVAEGVETVEQVEKLQAYGCHIAQGYLYSKPVPKTAFEELPRLFEAYVNGA
jgi:diguanylate cyclase (GGDEF)-like protein